MPHMRRLATFPIGVVTMRGGAWRGRLSHAPWPSCQSFVRPALARTVGSCSRPIPSALLAIVRGSGAGEAFEKVISASARTMQTMRTMRPSDLWRPTFESR
jgi:hypothetical protein